MEFWCHILSEAAQSLLSFLDRVRNRLSGLVGDGLFSTLQPLSRSRIVTRLSLFYLNFHYKCSDEYSFYFYSLQRPCHVNSTEVPTTPLLPEKRYLVEWTECQKVGFSILTIFTSINLRSTVFYLTYFLLCKAISLSVSWGLSSLKVSCKSCKISTEKNSENKKDA